MPERHPEAGRGGPAASYWARIARLAILHHLESITYKRSWAKLPNWPGAGAQESYRPGPVRLVPARSTGAAWGRRRTARFGYGRQHRRGALRGWRRGGGSKPRLKRELEFSCGPRGPGCRCWSDGGARPAVSGHRGSERWSAERRGCERSRRNTCARRARDRARRGGAGTPHRS